MQERLFVAKKPVGISSNHFLSQIKRKYGVKKAGFSGTLDPFACGNLVIAFGNYTKLFDYLNTDPKTYIATIWIGAKCQSLDNENITSVQNVRSFSLDSLEIIRQSLLGEISYTPPIFSAKKINGVRAYKKARNGDQFSLQQSSMKIYSSKIINYSHPFLTIKLTTSKGAYIRSYAQLFCEKLGIQASLSHLERISEGKFKYDNEKALNPIDFIDLPKNSYNGTKMDFFYGSKLEISQFSNQNNGKYIVDFDDFFSIIDIADQKVKYCLNRVKTC